MAYKQKGFSPFTQFDPVKKPVGPVTPSTKAEYMNRQVWNLVQDQQRNTDGQDVVKPKEEQIKDLQGDIKILQNRGNSGDDKKIKILQNEISRLQESPLKQGADAAEMRRYKRYERTGKVSAASKGNERQGMSEEKRFKAHGKLYKQKARGQAEKKKLNREKRRASRFSG